MLHTPLYQQDSSYSATDFRIANSAIWTSAGVIGSGDLAVSQHASGANMSVDVAVGTAIILGSDISNQHKYVCYSDAVTNVTLAAAPGTGLSRISLIVAKVLDADQDGGSVNDWQIVEVAGTAASTGSQVAPSAPASSLVLAHVLVGPNVTTIVTGNISEARTPAQMPKGIATATIATSETATSSSPVDLATPGPSVTMLTGTSVLIWVTALMANTTPSCGSEMSIQVSGATTTAAPAGPTNLFFVSGTAAQEASMTALIPITGLTPGLNTFEAKYNASAGGTASFAQRNVTVQAGF